MGFFWIKLFKKKGKVTALQNLFKGAEGSAQNFANALANAYQSQSRYANPTKPREQLYPENIVIISLLGFFAKVADSSEDFKRLPLLMKENFEPTHQFTKEEYDNNLNDTPMIQHFPELAFLMAKGYDFFENPFMKPIQYRGDTCFKTNAGFPDCGETSLRNIFMMLLGKQGVIMPEALDNLKRKIDPLDGVDLDDPERPLQKLTTFFKAHPPLADAATRQSHDAWAEVVSDLNHQEELGTLAAVQYGRGGTQGEKETQSYEIKASFSNIGVTGIINMLNVIAKIIPDKHLNKPWATDEATRLQQITQKFTRFCELLSRDNQIVTWKNKNTQNQTITSPFPTITLMLNYQSAYTWQFMPRHFQINSQISEVRDWRVNFDDVPFPNEWFSYFYTKFKENKWVENDQYGKHLPLTFIYHSQIRSFDGVLQTISFVLYQALVQKEFTQFLPLITRWIGVSVPINDHYALTKFSLLLYGLAKDPKINAQIATLLKTDQFKPLADEVAKWAHQDYNLVIDNLIKSGFFRALLSFVENLGFGKKVILSNNLITPYILESINKFTNLTSLDLKSNLRITDENLKNLKSLSLAWNTTITDNTLKKFKNLTSLDLTTNNTITNNGLQNLTTLTSLTLSQNNTIKDDTLKKTFKPCNFGFEG